MRVRVVVPPDPIVQPEDISGVTSGDEAVAALIQAVTEEIDGPSGWVGRAFGPQTIELSAACWGDRSIRLPYPPIIEIDGVTYTDPDGVEQTVDGGDYALDGDLLWFRPSWYAPALGCVPWPVKVTYQAGYEDDTTGPVPERARQAIILSVQHLRSLNVPSLYLKADEVEGIGRKEFTLSDQATKIIEQTTGRLLSTLRIYR